MYAQQGVRCDKASMSLQAFSEGENTESKGGRKEGRKKQHTFPGFVECRQTFGGLLGLPPSYFDILHPLFASTSIRSCFGP